MSVVVKLPHTDSLMRGTTHENRRTERCSGYAS